MKKLLFSQMLTDKGWCRDVLVEVDPLGMIASLKTGSSDGHAPRIGGVAVPGVPNAHSHAHQRLLAGLAEAGSGRGDFMRWRELMYRMVRQIDPETFEAVAALAYMEMQKAGYTSVAEFHYLHHDADGSPYAQPAEMGLRCIAAAREVGIAMTLLPVLYVHGGFGARPANHEQQRFACDPEMYMEIFSTLHKAADGLPATHMGFAPHSLRAVDETLIEEVLAAVLQVEPDAPAHIHVAEQRAEVDACVAWCGARPVQRLLDRVDVDARWNLVHATHANDAERRALAATGATVVLCPSTEANLGDGVFPLSAWLELNGAFAVGSDSQVGRCPADELRLLEYVQRLVTESRLVLSAPGGGSVGRFLLECVLQGGVGSMGHPPGGKGHPPSGMGQPPGGRGQPPGGMGHPPGGMGHPPGGRGHPPGGKGHPPGGMGHPPSGMGHPPGLLAEGARADIVVLDDDHPSLIARTGDDVLDSWIFSGGAACVRDVFVGGRQVVRDHRHVNESAIVDRYRAAAESMLS